MFNVEVVPCISSNFDLTVLETHQNKLYRFENQGDGSAGILLSYCRGTGSHCGSNGLVATAKWHIAMAMFSSSG